MWCLQAMQVSWVLILSIRCDSRAADHRYEHSGSLSQTGWERQRSSTGHLPPSRRSDLGKCVFSVGAYGVLPPKSMESHSRGQETPRLTSANANLLNPYHGV